MISERCKGFARRFAAAVLAVSLAAACGCRRPEPTFSSERPPRTRDRPNLLVFIADDQGYGDLSAYGHPVLRTPSIDRIAREGALFERAFLTISSCSPSRASILTGLYPHRTGAPNLHDPLPGGGLTIACIFRQGGYHVAAVGKWHLGEAEKDHWDRVIECPGRETADRALEVLADRPRDRPFFLWVASRDPHRPFDRDAIETPYDPADVIVPPYLPDHPAIRAELALYYGEITRFDGHVGRILDALEREGVLDRTFVVYLSDNGMPFPRAKTTLYDSGIRTPLLIRYPPAVRPGTVVRGLVSAIDIAPTLLEVAGYPAPYLPGRSVLPLLASPGAPGRDAVFAEANWHDYAQFTRAVRTEKFLLVRNYYWDVPLWNSVDSIHSPTWRALLELREAGKLTPAQEYLFVAPRPFEELYDLERDPHALQNVVDDPRYREELYRLRTRLDNWRVETRDRMPKERKPDGWTRDGIPLPHNQPWYDRWRKEGRSAFEKI